MEQLVIEGGRRLEGELEVQGSKNSALPILAAAAVTGETSILRHCPRLRDTDAAMRILRYIGCEAERAGDAVIVRSDAPKRWDIPDDLMREMRSSIIFLGALLSRFGRAELSAPGGCDIGLRPIDLHLSALSALGVQTEERCGRLCCSAPNGLRGASVTLPFPSVGATENAMLCAVCADGETVIRNAAREPEICDLAAFLTGSGANVRGAGTDTVTVRPAETFRATEYTIMPDRIMAASFLAAAAVTGGKVCLRRAAPQYLVPVLPYFEQAGCVIKVSGEDVLLHAPNRLRSVRLVRTMPYPGFPTDMQSQAGTALALARGTSIVIESIFENRFRYLDELARMGASFKVEGNTAIITGVKRFTGADIKACDLRAGAALVLAGLSAEGFTTVSDIHYIQRGYEHFEKKLQGLGAEISIAEDERDIRKFQMRAV